MEEHEVVAKRKCWWWRGGHKWTMWRKVYYVIAQVLADEYAVAERQNERDLRPLVLCQERRCIKCGRRDVELV